MIRFELVQNYLNSQYTSDFIGAGGFLYLVLFCLKVESLQDAPYHYLPQTNNTFKCTLRVISVSTVPGRRSEFFAAKVSGHCVGGGAFSCWWMHLLAAQPRTVPLHTDLFIMRTSISIRVRHESLWSQCDSYLTMLFPYISLCLLDGSLLPGPC